MTNDKTPFELGQDSYNTDASRLPVQDPILSAIIEDYSESDRAFYTLQWRKGWQREHNKFLASFKQVIKEASYKPNKKDNRNIRYQEAI